MSTNSTVAIRNEDKSVTGIYVHWDGMISGVGAELLENYTTVEKVQELIMNGDCSSIIDDVDPYTARGDDWIDIAPKIVADATNQGKDWDIFLENNKQEYNYIFENGVWYVTSDDYDKVMLKELIGN